LIAGLGSSEDMPYQQFSAKVGGGKFSMGNPKSNIDLEIYRTREVSSFLRILRVEPAHWLNSTELLSMLNLH